MSDSGNGNGLTKSGKKIGRPLKQIDAEQVRGLAAIGCTLNEMATFFKCGKATLSRRFGTVIREGADGFKMSLRRLQYQSAKSGSVRMQIHLGEHYLEQYPRRAVLAAQVETETALFKVYMNVDMEKV